MKDEIYQLKMKVKQGSPEVYKSKPEKWMASLSPSKDKIEEKKLLKDNIIDGLSQSISITVGSLHTIMHYFKIIYYQLIFVFREKAEKKREFLIEFQDMTDQAKEEIANKLLKVQSEANEWKRRWKILGEKYLEEIQKVRLSVEMFKNEVLGVHKEMQMKCIDDILIAQK